jgi:transmembrane sensor
MSEPVLATLWIGTSSVDIAAARFLARQQSSDWTAADQSEFDAWLGQSTGHMISYLRLQDAWARADRLAALRPPMRKMPAVSSTFGKNMLRLTAGLVLAAGAALFAVINFPTTLTETTYSTPVGGREIIALSDGSQVELNTDTVLQIAKTNPRAVTLVKGEAFFQIRHNVANPFVVTAFGHRITDLGTKFAVRGSAQHLVVTLVEGRARVDSESTGKASAVLAPGDVAVATANTVLITKKPTEILGDQLAWREGMLVFNRATLAEVADEFNRYNAHKIVIADPQTARLALMGKFPVNDVELFGRVARAVLGVRVIHRGEEIIVTSKPDKN